MSEIHVDDSQYSEVSLSGSIIFYDPFLEVKESLKQYIDIIFDTKKFNFFNGIIGIILTLSSSIYDSPEVSHLSTRIKIKNKNDIEKVLNNSYFKHLRIIFSSFDAAIQKPYIGVHAGLKYYTHDSRFPSYMDTYF